MTILPEIHFNVEHAVVGSRSRREPASKNPTPLVPLVDTALPQSIQDIRGRILRIHAPLSQTMAHTRQVPLGGVAVCTGCMAESGRQVPLCGCMFLLVQSMGLCALCIWELVEETNVTNVRRSQRVALIGRPGFASMENVKSYNVCGDNRALVISSTSSTLHYSILRGPWVLWGMGRSPLMVCTYHMMELTPWICL